MRVRVVTLSLALAVGAQAIGCKSAPKLPWFSSADTAKAGAASATTASAAPTLPSEIAKQSEALAGGADPVKITTTPVATTAKTAGGAVAANVAATTPNPYPSTGAQDYLSNSAAALKSAATNAVAGGTSAPKFGLPYDPTAVPPSVVTPANGTADVAAPNADRYGLQSQDRYANAYPTTPDYNPASDPSSIASSATVPSASRALPYASAPSPSSPGDRYAAQSSPTVSPNANVPSSTPPTVQPASAVATLQPYRPGGTSSYPGTSASYEVATRPGATSTSTATNGPVYR